MALRQMRRRGGQRWLLVGAESPLVGDVLLEESGGARSASRLWCLAVTILPFVIDPRSLAEIVESAGRLVRIRGGGAACGLTRERDGAVGHRTEGSSVRTDAAGAEPVPT